MQLQSLAHLTDLIFSRFEAEISSGQDEKGKPYLCVRTPERPDYFWGNTLIFSQPPEAGDLAHWRRVYLRHFPAEQGFMTVSWDSPQGEAGASQAFVQAGFRDNRCSVLGLDSATLASLPAPARFNPQLEIRPLHSDADWQAAVEVHINGHWKLKPEHEYAFTASQLKVARQMAEAGLGLRYGAFAKGQLVGDLGLYVSLPEQGPRLGRFHLVGTHRDFFRQGVCSSLLYRASQLACERWQLDKLVIVADASDFPQQLYQSVGFSIQQWQPGLEWRDKQRFG